MKIDVVVAIQNIIMIICWTVLAIFFNKWWIALFAVLFLTSVEAKLGHRKICDKCGKKSEYAESSTEATRKAEATGWLCIEATNEDYCPECRKNFINK